MLSRSAFPAEELPSDRVTGMHTGHPDEAPGNTLFHHSFSVTFLKVRKPDQVYTDSVIYGVIHNAAGRTAQLLRAETVVSSQVVAGDETFRFTDLGAGEYLVAVGGTQLRSTPVRVNGQDQAYLDLTLVLAESTISGRVRNGVGRTLWLTRSGTQVATQAVGVDEAYRFAELVAGIYRVAVAGTQVTSAPITLTGMDAATVDLIVPVAARRLPTTYYLARRIGPPLGPIYCLPRTISWRSSQLLASTQGRLRVRVWSPYLPARMP